MITFSSLKKIISIFLFTGFFLQNSFAQVPTINSFTPSNGQVQIGDVMSIHGSNFSNNPADLIVRFGTAVAKIQNASTTSLDVIVPYGANSGNISVQNIVTGRIGYSHTPNGNTNRITLTRTWQNTLGGATYFNDYYNPSGGNGSPMQNTEGDFNNDGRTDFVTITTSGAIQRSLRNVNNTGFVSLNIATPGVTFCPTLPVADFNGDGNLDFCTVHTSGPNVNLKFYMGAGDGSFTIEASSDIVQPTLGATPRYAIAADFNKDGRMDLAFSMEDNVFLYVRNATNNGFNAYGNSGSVFPGVGGLMSVGDFNNDGYPDIALGAWQAKVGILLTNGATAGFSSVTTVNCAAQYARSVVVTDYNNDGNDDIIYGGYASNNFGFMSGNGAGIFTDQTPVGLIFNSQDVKVGDLNGDGYVDVAIINYNGATGNIETYTGDGSTFTYAQSYIYITSGPACGSNYDVDIVDYNDDGMPDIMAGFTCVGPPVHENITLMYFRPNLVITSAVSGAYCDGQTIAINFTAAGFSGNVNAELSDMNGSFASPTGIGTTTTGSPSINATIPPGTLPGTGYRIRLVYNTGVGADNNVDFEVVPAPMAVAGPTQDLCPAGSPTVFMAGNPPAPGTGTWTGPGTIVDPSNPITQVTGLGTGSHMFTWTVTNGGCLANDFVTINIVAAPTVDPGGPLSGCGTANVPITGVNANNYSLVSWTTSGDGTFSPDGATLNADYIPSTNDVMAGTVSLMLSVNNSNPACTAASTNFSLTLANGGDVEAGTDQTVCTTTPQAFLFDATSTTPGSISWSTSGTGNFNPDNLTLNSTYIPSAADLLTPSVTLTLDLPANGACPSDQDAVIINFVVGPTVDPGTSLSGCGTGTVSITTAAAYDYTSINWTTSGDGSFNPDAATLNPDYIPSANDVTAGSITLMLNASITNPVCATAATSFSLTISSGADVAAGTDKTVCKNNAAVNLTGATSTNPASTTWNTSGTGTFNPNNTTLSATYVPSAADLLGTSVTLTLDLPAIAPCAADNDALIVNFTPAPTIDAGPTVGTMCTNNTSFAISGSVTVATGGTWSTNGGGSFTNKNALSTNYLPSPADIASGSVMLSLASTGNGTCAVVTDVLTLNITPSPTAFAGNDQNVCKNNSTVSLNGSFSNAGTVTWSGGIGSFSPGNTSAVATYIPVASEVAAGQLTLTITTNDPDGAGPCVAASDPILIRFTNAPTVNAGNSGTSCTNNPDIQNHGTVTVATGGTWTTTGTGTFTPSANSLNAVYHPTPADTLSGSVTLTLTTTGNGNCLAVNNQRTIVFTPKPIVEAGTYPDVCGNISTTLSGMVVSAGGGRWSTPNGNGSFSPESNVNSKYIPSESDGGKTIMLILSSTGNAGCLPVRDTAFVNVLAVPNSYAGENFKFCDFSVPASLNATTPGANEVGTWSQVSGATTVVFDDPNAHVTNATNLIAEGEFIFQWQLTNTITGCKDSSVVHVFQCELPEVVVFNVLSPNADGKHDFLELEYAEVYPKNRVLIYNRWGEIVFETTGYDNKDITFTGKSNVGKGDDLPDGTYYYVIIPKEGGDNEKGFFVIRH